MVCMAPNHPAARPADGYLSIEKISGTARMCLLLGRSALSVDWDTLDSQERSEVFLGLAAPPQWVRVENEPMARAVEGLQCCGYVRTGWHHCHLVYKLTEKGSEA